MFCFNRRGNNSINGNSRISSPAAHALTLSPTLLSWQNLPCNVALVHTIPGDPEYLTKFLLSPAEKLFREWDIISTSLFKFQSHFVQKRRMSFEHLSSPLDHKRITSAYHKWGFVLEVPPQNIVGTYECDIYFPNHIGAPGHLIPGMSKLQNKALLSENILGTLGEDGAENPLTKKTGFNEIKTPRAILDNQWNYYKNEVLVMGRPDVQYHSMASKEIKVTGIVRFSDKKFPGADSRDCEIMKRLKEINSLTVDQLGFEKKNNR